VGVPDGRAAHVVAGKRAPHGGGRAMRRTKLGPEPRNVRRAASAGGAAHEIRVPLRPGLPFDAGLTFATRRHEPAPRGGTTTSPYAAGICWVMQWIPPPPFASVAPGMPIASRPG
jgi:hypothetical protein